MRKSLKSSPESALIERIRSRFTRRSSSVTLGIGDDCAILRPHLGREILVTTDFSLEGRHFRRDTHPAASVGHRTLARGLSDLAAMGATPLAAFLSLALPADLVRSVGGRRWVDGFLTGLHALAQAAKVPLAGGDTAQSPGDEILADIVLLGTAPTGTALRRSTARAGDVLYVTGSLGGAAAELRTLLDAPRRPGFAHDHRGRTPAAADHPHLYPQPRLAVGRALRSRRLASASIDLSDGLSTDLTHLCVASGVRAEIEANALPLHLLAKGDLDLALHGGEDYELLFAASSATRIPPTLAGTPVTAIGRLLRPSSNSARIVLLRPGTAGRPLEPRGWQHFND